MKKIKVKECNANSEELRELILNEAINIGDELLRDAEIEEIGISWKTISADEKLNVSWIKTECLYNGTAGISLFLLELYDYTKKIKYLDAALKAIDWLMDTSRQKFFYFQSLFAGKLGIGYLMLRTYEITKDKSYREHAIKFTQDKVNFSEHSPICDMLNGIAGTLLGFLIMYSKTLNDSFLSQINTCIRVILENVHIGNKGIYWDRITDEVSGLCGFSHGASGVGYVFLELGNCFKNPAFYYIAQQAFNYDNSHFNEGFNNWPDLRKLKTTKPYFDEFEKEYLNNNTDYFSSQSDMNAWCHGASGIGLSRIRANQLFKNKVYQKDIKRAINKTMETDLKMKGYRGSVILCHGRAGNAELFIENYLANGDITYLDYAYKVAVDILTSKEVMNSYNSGYFYESAKGMEDNSLFMGKAGIGYFFLRLLDPHNTPSILIPKVNLSIGNKKLNNFEYINLKTKDIKKILVSKIYKRTYNISSRLIANKTPFFSNNHEKEDISKLIRSFENTIKKQCLLDKNNTSGSLLKDVFKYENTVLKYERSIFSNAWFDMKRIQLEKQSEKLIDKSDKEFKDLILKLDQDVKLVKTCFDLASCDNKRTKKSGKMNYYYILKKSSGGIIEMSIPKTSYIILKYFNSHLKVLKLLNAVLGNSKNIDLVELDQQEKLILGFIKRFVKLQILVK